MTKFLADSLYLLGRHIRVTLRMPVWIAVSLIQPVIWLTLFGQLFRRVVELPGFGAGSYIEFLTPGVVVMTALFGSAWSGMGIIQDLNEGRMDRLLATPVHRGAIIFARVLQASLVVGVQCVIVLVLGFILKAGLPESWLGAAAVLVPAILIAAGFSAVSNGIALLARREETLIAVVNFFGLPLTFLSASFMAQNLLPGWMRTIASFNPVNWAVAAARGALSGADWAMVWIHWAELAAFAGVCAALASLAFRAYRRVT